VVIWLRKWNDEGNEAKVLPIAQLEIPSQRPTELLLVRHYGASQWGDTNPTGNSGNAIPAFTGRLSLNVFGIKQGRIGKKGCEANLPSQATSAALKRPE
jgi:hypothetical protein